MSGFCESHTYRNHGSGNRLASPRNTLEVASAVWPREILDLDEDRTAGQPTPATCYLPHSSKTKLHAKAWDEIETGVSEYKQVGHVVVFGDFNAHVGCNGDTLTDTAG